MPGLIYHQTVIILAPITKVWDALTNPDTTPKYISGCQMISNFEKESPVIWRSIKNHIDHVTGKVIECEPQKHLSFTAFDPSAGYIDDPVNYLTTTYSLFPEAKGTRLEVSQGNFTIVENGSQRYKEAVISWEMNLASFKRMLED